MVGESKSAVRRKGKSMGKNSNGEGGATFRKRKKFKKSKEGKQFTAERKQKQQQKLSDAERGIENGGKIQKRKRNFWKKTLAEKQNSAELRQLVQEITQDTNRRIKQERSAPKTATAQKKEKPIFSSPFQRKKLQTMLEQATKQASRLQHSSDYRTPALSGDSEAVDQNNKFDQKHIEDFPEKDRSGALHNSSIERLREARFRFLNEQLYSSTGSEAVRIFSGRKGNEDYQDYHRGYQQQAAKWPCNPLDKIIQQLKQMSPSLVVADLGCGDGRLALEVRQKVHSFDLVSLAPHVKVCDMSRTPLNLGSVDVVVFCLSLMGTNVADFLLEANRILKVGGLLKIVEVGSRFVPTPDPFIRSLRKLHFKLLKRGTEGDSGFFLFLDCKKTANVGTNFKASKAGLQFSLQPCVYKRR
ncbi:unnamed protein product [Cyprideis torosa]|uniref:Ribosomal RNA-processing protein 8 n=1 Tax=Cyprideis torosa TaxID=163714 RepID=A0A7R8ZG36_9CRUS|nr:unnamed protein product [Cyprideis torosa]CAG0880665.1 unnamed protein product [Cyprideis torosa]